MLIGLWTSQSGYRAFVLTSCLQAPDGFPPDVWQQLQLLCREHSKKRPKLQRELAHLKQQQALWEGRPW